VRRSTTQATAPSQRWTPSRTPDGQPDLQGVWADNTVTPFETACGTGRQHASTNLRFWSGDSRARWDGDTLVIDTTNFSVHPTFRQKLGFAVSGENVHLVERLTPIDQDTRFAIR